MIAVALFKQGAPGFESIGANPQGAFPVLVSNLLPVGLRGLVLAGMLSALMSALASLFNSTATLFTVDFYKRLRPQSSERHLVLVGRLATAVVILLGMAWIPFLQDLGKGQLYTYLQLVQSLLAPSIAAVFMLGIFSRGVTPHSGLIGIVTGFVVGMLRLVLQATHEMYHIEWPGLVQAFVDINWLYFSFLLFVFTCVLIFAVSAVTQKAPPEQLAGLTYGSVTQEQDAADARELRLLGDLPHRRDPRDHRRHLHLLLVAVEELQHSLFDERVHLCAVGPCAVATRFERAAALISAIAAESEVVGIAGHCEQPRIGNEPRVAQRVRRRRRNGIFLRSDDEHRRCDGVQRGFGECGSNRRRHGNDCANTLISI